MKSHRFSSAKPDAVLGRSTPKRSKQVLIAGLAVFVLGVSFFVFQIEGSQLTSRLNAGPILSFELGDPIDHKTKSSASGRKEEPQIASNEESESQEVADNTSKVGRLATVATAFADLADGAAPKPEQSIGGAQVIPIKYALPKESYAIGDSKLANDGSIEVTKTLVFEQKAVGSIAVRIDKGSTLFVAGGDVKNLLSDHPQFADRVGSVPHNSMVTFQKLRDYGLNFRYNPVEDQLVLTTT